MLATGGRRRSGRCRWVGSCADCCLGRSLGNRTFSGEEYDELTRHGHWPIILQLRAARRAVQNGGNNGGTGTGGGGPPREISGVGTASQGQISQVTDGSQQSAGQQQQHQGGGSERGGSNGTGFGSGAYQN